MIGKLVARLAARLGVGRVTTYVSHGWGWASSWVQRRSGKSGYTDNISGYRRLYADMGYVRGAVNHIAEQSVQTGPTLDASEGQTERARQMTATFRPLAYAPHETLTDWLIDLAVYHLVDGEVFIRRLPGVDCHFEVLDAELVHEVIDGDQVVGYRLARGRPLQWRVGDPNYLHLWDVRYPGQTRGLSLLAAALEPGDLLWQSAQALSAAVDEYGRLRGYWMVAEEDWAELEGRVPGESPEERSAREKRNDNRMQSRFEVPDGESPKVHEGTTYNVIERGGDAYLREYSAYVRVQVGRISRALGVPEYVVSGSVAETNYSALRISRAEAEYRYRATQRTLEAVLRWVWPHYCRSQGLPESELTRILWPPQPPLDLQREAYALSAVVRDKMLSRRSAAEMLGRDWDTELERMTEEQEEFVRRDITMPSPAYPSAPEDRDGGSA